ncbi:hypothetical protein [Cellulosimicrobium funkei]|uniref:hypothetical protein n=1 Tax=Cellulosimicrobium funkei TaxID=264251 RepID=UPI00341FAEDB
MSAATADPGTFWQDEPSDDTPLAAANLNARELALMAWAQARAGETIQSATDGRLRGASGRVYDVIAGVLRNTGSGWEYLDDGGHQPTNIAAVSSSSTAVTIDFGVSGSKVASLIVGTDETLSRQGVLAGASVGLSSAAIWITQVTSQTISDYVSYNGSAWQSASGVFTDFAFASGTLTLTHAAVPGTGGAVAPRAGGSAAYDALLGSLGPTTTQVEWFNASRAKVTTADANMRAYVTRHGPTALTPINPSTFVSANGNLWVLGLIEVAT